jgi:hypothetical protein
MVCEATPEQEELCYARLDLATLDADMARQKIDARHTKSELKVGTFNVSVQATAAVQRARQQR